MLVTMTDKELYRLGIIQRVFDRSLLQREAADILELSVRQVQRLVRLYRTVGATAFASSRRGRPANNRIDEEIRCKALDLIRCHYPDFGPTLATEKLAERHHIQLSVETVRNWMTADGLVQIDGSHHDWFEGRAPKCCLLVFMDDATGRLMHLRFCDSENAFDYMMATRQYIDKYGKPVAFYSDKHAVFRVSGSENTRIAGEKITVFDYPDGTLAFKYGYRSLKYQVFDKLECVDQGQIVDNKRLGAVLKLVQSKMDELERDGKRDRSKKMPKRRAQARVQEQLRAIVGACPQTTM